jgi:photosystem II stability/assembly factor-like uncharacterized protein
MSTLIAVGDMADKLVGWGALTTSLDGLIWTDIVEPFPDRGKINGIAHGNGKYVVAGDAGLLGYSTDNIHYTTERLWFGTFHPLAIRYGTYLGGGAGKFMIVGQKKFFENDGPYAKFDETAQIMRNTTGLNSDWELVYSCPIVNSRFYNIRRINTAGSEIDGWFALGTMNGRPFGLYSVDNGDSWYEITFPTGLGLKYAYDICYTTVNNTKLYWISVNGCILSTPSLINPKWNVSPTFAPSYGTTDFVRIASNGLGHVVAVCSGGIAYTIDQVGWKFVEQPGYRFKSVTYFNNTWIVGAESNLTTYTHWTSKTLKSWTPANCGVQIYDFIII